MVRPLLIAGHPGHELMIHGWLVEARPRVWILTDGSGRSGESRLASSARIVREAGAEEGAVWGLFSDRAVYRAILEGDIDSFLDLALRLSDQIAETRPPYVVADAREGVNPTHDLCRMIVDAAVRRARRGGLSVPSYAYALSMPHDRSPREGAILRTLREDELERKLAAAHAYPELMAEVEAVVSGSRRAVLGAHEDLAAILDAGSGRMSVESLRTECLFPAPSERPADGDRPFYEIYGERVVAAGGYERTIRYAEHVQPIEQALAAL